VRRGTVEGDHRVGASGHVLVDDAVQFVEIAACSWAEPDEPCLLSDLERHFTICSVDVAADVRGPGNTGLRVGDVGAGTVVYLEALDLAAKLIIHARNCAAGIGRITIRQGTPRHRGHAGSECLRISIVIAAITAGLCDDRCTELA
jgi:hypothetical protein